MSPWLSVMKPRCLRPWVGNPENFSFNTFENSVKPYLWIRGTELPRTESREGRKKASAAVCTMSRLAPRSRTWNILFFQSSWGYLPKWVGHRRYNIGECICIFIEKTFRKFQREDALACGNNWKEMVVDAIGKSNV